MIGTGCASTWNILPLALSSGRQGSKRLQHRKVMNCGTTKILGVKRQLAPLNSSCSLFG